MARTYYRIQPAGADLFAHTSVTSNDEPVDDGYVFAFTTPEQVMGVVNDWLPEFYVDCEVVTFHGDDAYDPCDAEGIAVLPVRELARASFAEWVATYGTPDQQETYRRIRAAEARYAELEAAR